MAKQVVVFCDRGYQQKCKGFPCKNTSTSIDVIQWNGCEGTHVETINVTGWTPGQLQQLRACVEILSSSDAHLQAAIPDFSLRQFHFLHQLIGPDRVKAYYPLDTIRHYRRRLRNLGFEYPPRPSVPGPGRPRIQSDGTACGDSVAAGCPGL